MKISYKDLTEDFKAVDEAFGGDPLSKYAVEIEGELKTPNALRVLSVVNEANSFEQRAQFVKELLTGCHITVYKHDKKLFDLGVTTGTEWWAVDAFNKEPYALKYVVTSVYTRFLKNFVA